jgi:TetR/AcrR family transcriptional repressor of mexJK operon
MSAVDEETRLDAAKTPFTARRGRPSAAQLAAISETILSTAQALFLSQGYANTSMEAIVAASGVSKATLYARYANKHELFQAIVEARMRAWQAAAAADRAAEDERPDQDIAVWLRHRAVSMLRALRQPEIRAFDHLVVSEGSRFPELARLFHEMGYMLNVRAIATRLSRADGQASPTQQTLLAAKLFASGLVGWIRQESGVGEVTDAACEAAAGMMARLLIDGQSAWRAG